MEGGEPVVLQGLWEAGSTASSARVSQLFVAAIDVAAVWPSAPFGVDIDVVLRVGGAAGEQGGAVKFKVASVQVC
jgi:hypothetical protein